MAWFSVTVCIWSCDKYFYTLCTRF